MSEISCYLDASRDYGRPNKWVYDANSERPIDFSDPPPVKEIVTAIMVAGYENLAGHPILPSSVLVEFAQDLEIYRVSRTIKSTEDTFEYFEQQMKGRPHILAFLEDAFGIIEEAYYRGVSVAGVIGQLHNSSVPLMQLAIKVSNENPDAANGTLSERTWQAALDRELPHVEELAAISDDEVAGATVIIRERLAFLARSFQRVAPPQ